jgi:hypothetical protein
MNKSGTAGKTTKKARNPASRVDPMGADHRVVPAIKQALSMLPQPWSQRAMLTSNDYKELAARCTELASESSEPTVAEALRALASDYLARAAKLHFVFLEQGTRLQGQAYSRTCNTVSVGSSDLEETGDRAMRRGLCRL